MNINIAVFILIRFKYKQYPAIEIISDTGKIIAVYSFSDNSIFTSQRLSAAADSARFSLKLKNLKLKDL